MRNHDNMLVLYVPHQKKTFAKYRWRTHSQWQIALIHVVCSNGMTYANVVSVPTKEHNRYMTYITTYPLSGAHAFNTAQIVMHMLRERIHVMRKRSQDISRFSCPRCTVVASRMTNTQPLPHDRDCSQASLVLRGWVWDSHHPMGGNLHSYLSVDASLQNNKLHKVEPSQLATC
jgi:hypothetical protein